ncbi:MAG TPA: fasciclin domain-containing protein, partial [Longimicrobiales bacterium]|nr:fasciclin domain-containing protein [Longimicrobiales bacterium]
AIQAAGLIDALSAPGPFTVFAPVNSAFASLPAGELQRLLDPANLGELQELLQFHVVPGAFTAGDLSEGASLVTLTGEALTVSLQGGPSVNGISILETDIEASNGFIHLIGGVLLPSRESIAATAAASSGLTTLVAALSAAGLVDALAGDGPFTVFAPVNAAFAALGDGVIGNLLDPANLDLLTSILTYHVVPGAAVYAGELSDGQTVTTLQGENLAIGVSAEGVTVNGANVTSINIRASNGVIHLVDGVLVPELDIVETAIVTPQTQTLVAAVAAGGLVSTLQSEGPFTVFAPINEAFEALGSTAIENLLDPANQAILQKVLTYHVIAGDIRAADLTNGASVQTVQGTNVTIDLSGDLPMVNGASIIATDIVVGNGVIHLIDGVLTENLDLVDQAVINGFSTLVGAVQGAGLEATLRSGNAGEGFTVFAPTNEAFAALAAIPSGDALVSVLTSHVVGATVASGDLLDGQVVSTVEGSTFTVNIDGNGVSLTDATGQTVMVVLTDVPASNGVIHVIDGVILPGA